MASVLPQRTQFVLDESRIPRAWYNIAADLPAPLSPPLHPGTHQPIGPADLAPLFPMALILQEVSGEREIEIPDPVREAYSCTARRRCTGRTAWRRRSIRRRTSTTSTRASARPGSHKPNTAIPQAFFNKEEGVTRLATETGAGQWGSALSFAGAMFGLEVKVYMVRASYDQKPYRRILMETYGAQVVASPSAGDELRARGPRRDPGLAGLAGHGDLRGGRGRGDPRRHQVLAGLGAQPRPAAPDGRRARGARADGDGRRGAGRDHRLRRRRLELRGAHVPVRRPQAARRGELPGHRRRARGRPVADPRRLRLRLRRHRPHGADREDAHARQRVHPRADPRGRPALPRHGAARVAAQGARRDRRAERPPARRVRGRRPVRPGRGHPAGAREHARDQGRGRRGARRPRRPASRG